MVYECKNCRRNSTAGDFCSLCGERIIPEEPKETTGGGQVASPLADVIRRAMESKQKSGVVTEARKVYDARMKGATEETVIVLDSSGSMEEGIGGLQVTKWQHATIALEDIRKNYPKVRVIVFSDRVTEWKSGPVPFMGAGTNLSRALEFAGKWKPKKTIIISDGLPDDEDEAKEAALKLTGVVDTIYCGPDGHPAIQFLRSLSEKTCGTPIEWHGQTQLASNIRGLLGPG